MNTNETNSEIKLKPGRPTIPGSARQLKLQAAAERAEKGEMTRRGRPVNPSSKRQQETLQKQQIINNGGVIRPGRPRIVKVDTTVVASTADVKNKVDIAPMEEAEVLVG